MPELPEVETIKLGLQKKIVGKTIKKVETLTPKSFQGKASEIEGKKVIKVWRRAKILGIDLQGDKTILFHLKMTGQLIFDPSTALRASSRLIGGHPTPDMRDNMPNSHTREVFTFSDNSHLYFNDQRRFGWVKLVTSTEVISNELLQKLGPEPLEKSFTWQVLKQNLLRHKSMPIKAALMDQSVVAGVGNIYSNEACFDASLDPRTKVKDLTDEQFKNLYHGVVKSLEEGIKHKGSTRAHFVDSEGNKGYFLDYAFVYGMDGKKCKKCGTIIKKVALGGRGTFYCPKCQL